MATTGKIHPMHQALDLVARACIEENLLEEGETLLTFLELSGTSPFTAGLLRIWANSQRGQLRDALRQCDQMLMVYTDSSDVLALGAVLSYALKEARWRSMCLRLVDLPDCRPESRQVAESLLDGTFGRKKPDQVAAAGSNATAASEPPVSTFDPALSMHFVRG